MSELNELVARGSIREAFLSAADVLHFSTDSSGFVGFLANVLSAVGFLDESESLHEFARRHEAYKESTLPALQLAARENRSEWGVDGKQDIFDDPVMNLRARYVARFLEAPTKVLDLGCGNMFLEGYLPPECEYVPCDLRARDERTLVCDFEKLDLPSVPGISHVVCLGVMNYLHNQALFLQSLCGYRATILLSFKPSEFIVGKIEQGIFPKALPITTVAHILGNNDYRVTYQKILGGEEEVLFRATPDKGFSGN